MAPKPRKPREMFPYWNPLALWLMVHEGDPAPEKVVDVTTALAIHQLAAGLSDANLRNEIQGTAGKALQASAGALVRK